MSKDSARPFLVAAALVVAGCGSQPANGPVTNSTNSTGASTESVKPLAADEVPAFEERARQVWSSGNYAVAKKLLARILATDPQRRESSLMMADVLRQEGLQLMFEGKAKAAVPLLLQALEMTERATKDQAETLTEQEQDSLRLGAYDLACAASAAGDTDLAAESLRRALTFGYRDLDHIESSKDLAALRAAPEFEEIAAEFKQAIRAQMSLNMKAFEPFPFELQVTDIDGKPIDLSELREQVVIVDFWGTWVPQCNQEVPYFIRLNEAYRDRGFTMIGINLEKQTGDAAVKTVRDYIKRRGVNYRCAIGDPSMVPPVHESEYLPVTLFIDRTGTVRLKLGSMTTYHELEQALLLLLEEPAAK